MPRQKSTPVPLFPAAPLRDDLLAANDPRELHWLMMVNLTRLVRAAFPAAIAIELDFNQFLQGESGVNLVRVLDRSDDALWDLLSSDDEEVDWTTRDGDDWHDVRSELADGLTQVFHELRFPADPRGWTQVPRSLRHYRHQLADDEVLTGRWRFVPALGVDGDHAALRECSVCNGTGSHTGEAGAARCACVRRVG